MGHLHRRAFCLIAGFLLAVPCPGEAVLGPITFRGGSASPMFPNNRIRMDSQEVTIRLKKTCYNVDAVFRFFNTGKQMTEWVGFPKHGAGFISQALDFIRFQAWIEGKQVGVSEQPDFLRQPGMFAAQNRPAPCKMQLRWMVRQVSFPAHSRTTIRVRYEAHYEPSMNGGLARYIYGTSTYWKGKVCKAVFTIVATEIGGTKHVFTEFASSPGPRLMSENIIRYEIRDFEPWPDAALEIEYYRDLAPQMPPMELKAPSPQAPPPSLCQRHDQTA